MKTRYEEYSGNLPFFLACNIERTATNCSSEENWHENLEIQLCQDGEGFLTIDGNTQSFKKGDVAVCNCNTIHYTGTNSKINYTCIIINTNFCREAGIDHTTTKFQSIIKSTKLQELIRQLVEIYKAQDDVCHNAKSRRCLLDILIELRENHTEGINVKADNGSFNTIKQAIKYIRENYSKKLSLDEIAKVATVNKYTLSREFKRATNLTVVDYINRYRLIKVAELLAKQNPVSYSAEQCGFKNISYFTKVFKKHYGMLPSQYK